MLQKIVSGGQTGVDRAALDAGLAAGVACGGWCARGRLAEDGVLDERYPLVETPEADPAQRTAWNARDSDGTLVVARAPLRGGTALARQRAAALGRPLLRIDPDDGGGAATARAWIARSGIRVLNVAGPRESERPGIYAQARRLLDALLRPPPGESEPR